MDGMEETRDRRLAVINSERRPRLASLLARLDAGEAGALEALERRVRGDYEDLVREGKTRLADEAWSWALARVADVEASEEHAEREEAEGARLPEAPARWAGLRVRVSYLGAGGPQKPSSLVGRLDGVGERGIRIALDDMEEEFGAGDRRDAGSIVRRVRSARLICWPALLTLMPLPVSTVGEEG